MAVACAAIGYGVAAYFAAPSSARPHRMEIVHGDGIKGPKGMVTFVRFFCQSGASMTSLKPICDMALVATQ